MPRSFFAFVILAVEVAVAFSQLAGDVDLPCPCEWHLRVRTVIPVPFCPLSAAIATAVSGSEHWSAAECCRVKSPALLSFDSNVAVGSAIDGPV